MSMFAWHETEIDHERQRQHDQALMAKLLAKGFHPASWKLQREFRRKRRLFYR
ncbi:MAG: hypothetical protein SFU83_23745 [Meiothermus sp.]|nr:hypothetical protein [Meiothermus sp.]